MLLFSTFLPKLKKYQASFWVISDQAVVSGGSFAASILLSKWLGLSVFGQYTLLALLILVVLSWSQAYLVQPIMTLLPLKPSELQAQYSDNVYTLQWIFALLGALVLSFVLGLPLLPVAYQVPFYTIILLAGLVFCTLIADFNRKLLFIRQSFRLSFGLDTAQQLIFFGFLIFKYYTSGVVMNDALLAGILGFLPMISIGFFLQKFDFSDLLPTAIEHWKFGKWLLATALLQWLSGNFFILAAGSILGSTAIGAVRVAQSIMGILHLVFLMLENNLPTQAAIAFRDGGTTAMWHTIRRLVLPIGAGIMLLLLAVALSANYLMTQFYGQEFAPYSYVISCFCGVYVLVFWSIPLRIALRTLHQTQPIFIGYSVATAFSLLSASTLLSLYHINGLLIGLLITQIINLLIFIFYLKKQEQ